MNRWELLEALCGNRLSMATITSIEGMDDMELREGVIEFLLKLLHTRR